MKKLLVVLALLTFMFGCAADVPKLKSVGPSYLENLGFKVLGYEGFQWGIWGGRAWFLITDPAHDNIKYSVYLVERAGEIQLYNNGGWNNQKQFSIDKE